MTGQPIIPTIIIGGAIALLVISILRDTDWATWSRAELTETAYGLAGVGAMVGVLTILFG